MVRKTSIDVYNEIKASGLLSKRRLEVYEVVYGNGPLTANEVVEIVTKKYNRSYSSNVNAYARLNELRDSGVVAEMGVKPCPITGNNVIVWDVTDSLPAPLPKVKTKNQKREDILDDIRWIWKNTKNKTDEIKQRLNNLAVKVKGF